MPTVALIQMAMADERAANIAEAERLVREAAGRGGQIICLPELFAYPFWCAFPPDTDYFRWAEPVPGPTVEHFQRVAAEVGAVVVVPLWEKVGRSAYFNSAGVVDADGSYLGVYRKNHIPLNPVFSEKLYFKPGNLGYPVFKTRFGNVAVYICHDRHYPEGARCLALGGADIIVIPTATNDASLSSRVWEKELMAHAIFNEVYIAGVNRVGTETAPDGRQFKYYGRSLVANPVGDIMAQAGGETEIVLAACDWDEIDRRRVAWQFYRDRRPDTYRSLTELIP